ncbi:DinB family protein [Altibacter sp. HG106]|uniref:DinB family protein n=1 Tax=Altibacter sp. HG106 TaxID=3023937 RepID=UPI0023506AB2|nr:DinB family protein [Altibacter sp. HG106]MDC7995062.1 DinB family protein [Altibacter sp. HG106]
MKAYFSILLILLVGPMTVAQTKTNIPETLDIKAIWLEKWANSKLYLLEIAETMPEDGYDFKPSPRQMSFQEQLLHIQQNMHWLGTTYFSEETYTKVDATTLSKQQLLEALSERFDLVAKQVQATSNEKLSETVDFFAGPKNRLQMLQLLQDHVTHHRGQLIVYLNLKDLSPPRYVGW